MTTLVHFTVLTASMPGGQSILRILEVRGPAQLSRLVSRHLSWNFTCVSFTMSDGGGFSPRDLAGTTPPVGGGKVRFAADRAAGR